LADDYRINGYVLPCPTSGRWLGRSPIDVQGDGRPIYSPWSTLVAIFNEFESTGTAVAYLPAYPSITGSSFAFQEYSGVVVGEPQVGEFFHREFPTDLALVIGNIRIK